ncbi:MAG TPA: 16S rRNA (cytosine(1402)-N(4))-methyltransferase RsmH [Chthonomonadaceae bacterium]|nr:16S rRNA (cytosine(1402)-N(4))-methyltransferase RsmH [Chthonomonadaceae bacterium]
MTTPDANAYHEPVLLAETLHYLAPKPGEIMLDATLGGGGHSLHIGRALAPGGTLIGLDRDSDAHRAAEIWLEALRNQITIILLHFDFGKISEALVDKFFSGLDGILFDLGVSSHQLDTERGFSFRRDEPLDMRMDTTPGILRTAAELLATANEAEVARILWEYGEERFSRRIARTLAERRDRGEPVRTTGQLVAAVEVSIPRSAWPRDIHVATRTFQALRIAVNDEMGQLERGLNAAIDHLKPGGRVVVITYHSLEDRIVKQTFAREAGREPSASGYSPAAFLPNTASAPRLTLLTRKPVLPTEAEKQRNPRARSAKLRAAQRTADA